MWNFMIWLLILHYTILQQDKTPKLSIVWADFILHFIWMVQKHYNGCGIELDNTTYQAISQHGSQILIPLVCFYKMAEVMQT